MKILHTSDWHVGKLLRGISRLDEHRAVLAEIAELAAAEHVDCVLVTGDLFESAAPLPDAADSSARFGDFDIGAETGEIGCIADAVLIALIHFAHVVRTRGASAAFAGRAAAELPQAADVPLINTELPHTAVLPQAAELPHAADELLMTYACWVAAL